MYYNMFRKNELTNILFTNFENADRISPKLFFDVLRVSKKCLRVSYLKVCSNDISTNHKYIKQRR